MFYKEVMTDVIHNYMLIFSVNFMCKEELNLMLKISDFETRCGGFELGGTDFLLTNTLDPTLKESR